MTYGYNPLELSRYAEYLRAADQNHKLLNGLAVTLGIDTQQGGIAENPDVLPRICRPASRSALSAIHAAAHGDAGYALWTRRKVPIVEGSPQSPLAPGPTRVQIVEYTGDFISRRKTPLRSIACCASPYRFIPGWVGAADDFTASHEPV